MAGGQKTVHRTYLISPIYTTSYPFKGVRERYKVCIVYAYSFLTLYNYHLRPLTDLKDTAECTLHSAVKSTYVQSNSIIVSYRK